MCFPDVRFFFTLIMWFLSRRNETTESALHAKTRMPGKAKELGLCPSLTFPGWAGLDLKGPKGVAWPWLFGSRALPNHGQFRCRNRSCYLNRSSPPAFHAPARVGTVERRCLFFHLELIDFPCFHRHRARSICL